MNTPDTEWHMKALAKSECAKDAGELTVVRLGYVVSLMKEVASSRDTYWKERVRKEVEWQPIETAPKDGTHILVINLDTPEWNRVPTVAHWFELSVGDETRGNFFLSWNKNADDADYQMNTITHWKALDTLLDNLK